MNTRNRKIAAVLIVLLLALGTVWPIPEQQSASAETVVWDPLAQPVWEADTLFLPDLSSTETILNEGGLLTSKGDRQSTDAVGNFEFGQGRFGPAVRTLPNTTRDYLFYLSDGLIDGKEFTIEFWTKSETNWGSLPTIPFFRMTSPSPATNKLQIQVTSNGQIWVNAAGTMPQNFNKNWYQSIALLGLQPNVWYAWAFTLKDGTLKIYLNGNLIGQMTGVTYSETWSSARGAGIALGGTEAGSSTVWISDVRISRTARVPGQEVTLRPTTATIAADASTAVRQTPPYFLGALHWGRKGAYTEVPDIYPTVEEGKDYIQLVRSGKMFSVMPIKRGAPDAEHPTQGYTGVFSYDWQIVDRHLAFLEERGLVPFFSLSSTPPVLGGSAQPYDNEPPYYKLTRWLIGGAGCCDGGYGSEVPNSLEDWANMVKDFVYYVRVVKGIEVPYWGIWNEPNGGFWDGTMEQYLELYKVTANAIRSIDPFAKIGGPETTGTASLTWIEALFAMCAAENVPLDFISYHDYSGNIAHLEYMNERIHQLAAAYGFPTPFPIVVGEFGWDADARYNPTKPPNDWNRRFMHINAFGAAYLTAYYANALTRFENVESIIYSHWGHLNKDDGGWHALQMIGYNGEHWAPYNAYKGFKKVLGDEIIAADKDLPPGVFSIETRDSTTGRVGIALANFGFSQRRTRTVNLSVSGLTESGIWTVYRYVVDRDHSSRIDGGPEQDDLQLVDATTVPVGADRTLALTLDLPPWSSTFLSIERESSDSPTPTPSASPTPTPTPTSSSSPTPTPTPTPSCGLDCGLAAWWKLDETSGTTAVDTSGNGRHGTLVGGPAWTSDGRVGGALSFDGVNDYVSTPFVLDPAAGPMTVTAWLRPQQTGTGMYILMQDGGYSWIKINANGKFATNLTGPGLQSATLASVGTWTHFAVTWDGTTVTLYINGQAEVSATTAVPAPETGGLTIGMHSNHHSYQFKGDVDDIRVYDRALSAAEIASLYQN